MAAARNVADFFGSKVELDIQTLQARKAGLLPGTARDLELDSLFPQLEIIDGQFETETSDTTSGNVYEWQESDFAYINERRPNMGLVSRAPWAGSSEIWLKGNWMDWRVYEKSLFQFREELNYSLNSLSLGGRDIYPREVAIHVRLGDYVGSKKFRRLPASYFQRAIRRLAADGVRFSVYSDDIRGAARLIEEIEGGTRLYIQSGTSVLSDFDNMRRAPAGFIGSNSTFSWWIAFLGGNRPTVMPKRWFRFRTLRSSRGFYFPGWKFL